MLAVEIATYAAYSAPAFFNRTPVPFAEAVKLGKRGGARPGAGRPKKGAEREGGNQAGDTKLISSKGTTAAYLLARLDRDRPDLAAAVRACQFARIWPERSNAARARGCRSRNIASERRAA